MSKCIGGITHDVFGSVGALLSHSPDKSFGAYTRFGDSIVECDTLSFRLSSPCFSDFLRFCLWLRGNYVNLRSEIT